LRLLLVVDKRVSMDLVSLWAFEPNLGLIVSLYLMGLGHVLYFVSFSFVLLLVMVRDFEPILRAGFLRNFVTLVYE
jgi:hypothetical protein